MHTAQRAAFAKCVSILDESAQSKPLISLYNVFFTSSTSMFFSLNYVGEIKYFTSIYLRYQQSYPWGLEQN